MPEAEQLDMLQDVVVKIDADPPAADVVVKADDPVKDLAAQYKELEAKSAEREKATEAAEQREAAAQREASQARQEAAQARQEAAQARTAATASNLDTITTAIAASTAAIDAAKRDMRAAKEAGDFDAETDAQDRLTASRVDLRTYDEAKANLEARAKAPQQQRPADPVEAYIQGRTEPTANWLRQHREFVVDPRKNQKLTAAHHDAVAEGLSPDTTEYFTHVEKFIGVRKEAKEVTEGDNVQRPGAAKRPATRNVAPVNGARGSGGAVADNNEVHLSQGEAKSATDGTLVWNYDDPSGQKKFRKGDPIGIQEMARRKRSMGASGLYDRSFEVQ